MKYIKTYEKSVGAWNEYNEDEIFFKIGDHVKPVASTGYDDSDLIKDKIYTIYQIYSDVLKTSELEHSTDPNSICIVQDEDGKYYKNWFLKRFKPAELEYTANKYNL